MGSYPFGEGLFGEQIFGPGGAPTTNHLGEFHADGSGTLSLSSMMAWGPSTEADGAGACATGTQMDLVGRSTLAGAGAASFGSVMSLLAAFECDGHGALLVVTVFNGVVVTIVVAPNPGAGFNPTGGSGHPGVNPGTLVDLLTLGSLFDAPNSY